MDGRPEADVPLAPLTTWKIGGPADWLVSPETEVGLLDAVRWGRERGLPLHVLGRGSNVLISDEGLRGLVICLRAFGQNVSRRGAFADGQGFLEVPAGMSLPRLAKVVAGEGFGGYEFYIGIPGTVGGAVVMNAGFGPGDPRQTAARCREVRILDLQGGLRWEPYAAFHPVYRATDLVGGPEVVVGARFALEEVSTKAAIRAVTAEHLAMRRTMQPLTRPTAGSVFKGTAEGVPAAVYIDRCGLKGLQVGGARVSPKHANWIENTGGARAGDVLDLIRRVQEEVERREGIRLETEVRFLH